jgi:nitrate/nitrite transport system ATP-binding protein
MALLELVNISKVFESSGGKRHVLDTVNCTVEDGEFLSIVGYSGSGKSTLVSICAGLVPASAGEVRLRGKPLRGFAREAAIVFQNYSLLPWFSALENVRLAVEAAFPEWPASRQRERAVQYLELVGLKQALEKRPSQLSGGMRQRVAIARAFSVEPKVLFLDEPFGALDALTRATLQAELSKLRFAAARPITTVMITNSVEEAILLSDRIVPLSKGPRATLGAAIPVPIPHPRSAAGLLHDALALNIEARVIDYLTAFSPESRRGTERTPYLAAAVAERQAES